MGSTDSLTDCRETVFICTGSFPSAPLLQAFTKAPSKEVVNEQGLRTKVPLSDPSKSLRLSGELPVVDRSNVPMAGMIAQ